jgi:hypothetical protein
VNDDRPQLPGRLAQVRMDGELPARDSVPVEFDELNYQMAGRVDWVHTLPGRHWFSYFRLYGPLESYFDRSWKLGDITPV